MSMIKRLFGTKSGAAAGVVTSTYGVLEEKEKYDEVSSGPREMLNVIDSQYSGDYCDDLSELAAGVGDGFSVAKKVAGRTGHSLQDEHDLGEALQQGAERNKERAKSWLRRNNR